MQPAMPLRYMHWWRMGGYLLILAIIVFSLIPHAPQIDLREGDKLGHFLAYGSLMFWFAQLEGSFDARLRCAIGFSLMGVALEFTQNLTGYRSFDVLDMLANATGVLLGWLAALPRASAVFVRIEKILLLPRSR